MGMKKSPTWLLTLNGLYLALLLAILLLNLTGPDRYWVGTLNLYLPQVMWAVPGVVLLCLAFRVSRVGALVPLLGLLLVLGPVMGYRLHRSSAAAAPPGATIRVLTWNIKYGKHDLKPLIAELESSRPDVVLFQDAVAAAKGPLRDYFRNWDVRSAGQYLIASRYPLSRAELVEFPDYDRRKQSFLRCIVRVGDVDVALYDVHFKTPRRSLNAFKDAKRGAWYIPRAVERLKRNLATRVEQAEVVAVRVAEENGAVIVAGDLNSAGSSTVCETLRGAGLRDCFDENGSGYGYTYGQMLLRHRLPWVRFSWMRIDHIMVSSDLVVRSCRTGTGKASDHRPVMADVTVMRPGGEKSARRRLALFK